jgi:hypothetical protein
VSSLTSVTEFDSALQLIARQAQNLTLAGGAAIALRSPEDLARDADPSDEMTCRASAGDDAPRIGARLRVGSGFSGECVRKGKLLRCDDSETDPRVDRESCRRLGIRSLVAVPVKSDESVLGIIEVFSPRAKAFTDADISELQSLAEFVTSAVQGNKNHVVAQAAISTTNVVAPGKSKIVPPAQVVPPRILVETESAFKVFVRNLVDTVFRRKLHTEPAVSGSGPLWADIFVDHRLPWKHLLQSVLWHLIVVAAVWNLSQDWARSEEILKRTIASASQVTYYPSFAAATSHRPQPRAIHKVQGQSAQRSALVVKRASVQRALNPPPVKLSARGNLQLAAWTQVKAKMPVVAAPDLDTATPLREVGGRARLLRASVVGPPPRLEAGLRRGGITAPNAVAVAPPPTVEGSIRAYAGNKVGNSPVVGPAPAMPLHERSIASPVSFGGTGAVVGPPPSMPLREQASLSLPTLGGSGAVIGPPAATPSRSIASGMSLAGSGTVVAPAPGAPSRTPSTVAGVGLGVSEAVVGPPPAMPAREQANISTRGLGGSGTSVVPPPPSITGSAALGFGASSSLSGSGAQVVGPAPSLASTAGVANGIERSAAMNIRSSSPPLPPSKVEEPDGPDTQELPVRVIGLALALPTSSYFSNYEVFIAERRIAKSESQLIKLVYESRPYQRRLSEYGLNDSKVFKIRLTRDRSCDESAVQIAGDHYSELQGSAPDAVLRLADKDRPLPCYRTTADDYRKARAKAR